MKNAQAQNSSKGNAALALLAAAFLAMLLPGCRNPNAPRSAPAETGTIALTLEKPALGRAIMPEIALTDFARFRLAAGGAPAEAVWDGASGTAELPVGEQQLVVTAYLSAAAYDATPPAPAARAERSFHVNPGPNNIVFQLAPLPAGNGTFSWDISFPAAVTGGRIDILSVAGGAISDSVFQTIPFARTSATQWASAEAIAAGEYFARFTLDIGTRQASLGMDLHVYPNMTSHFAPDFALEDGHFRDPCPVCGERPSVCPAWPAAPGAPAPGIAGNPVTFGTVSSGGTHASGANNSIVTITGRAANYNGLDITGLQPGDEVVAVGRVSQIAPAGAHMTLNLTVAPHSQLTQQAVAASATFELRHAVPAGAEAIRIQTNPDNLMPFTVDHILVTRPGGGEPGFGFASIGLSPGADASSALHFGAWNGADSVEWGTGDNANSLIVSGDAEHFGVQLRAPQIQAGDTVTATGRVTSTNETPDSNRQMIIVKAGDWSPASNAFVFDGIVTNAHFTLTVGITAAHFEEHHGMTGAEIRIHNNVAANDRGVASFIIDSITIDRPNGGGEPGTVARTITLDSATSRASNDGNVANRINGFDWEAWTDARGVGPGSTMTIYTDGSFSSDWSETYNTLFRVGRRFPGQGTRLSDLGAMSLRYAATNFNSNRGATYLCVYGWTRGRTAGGQAYAQIEWYIVDNWRNWINAGNNPPSTLAAGYTHHGTLASNGHVYDIITGWRVNQPAIEGGNATFLQIFSVRRGSQLTGPGNNLSGTIDLSAHFARWNQIGPLVHDGTGTRAHWTDEALLYEISFTVEGFGGTQGSSGTGSVTALCITYGANRACTSPGTCSHCW